MTAHFVTGGTIIFIPYNSHKKSQLSEQYHNMKLLVIVLVVSIPGIDSLASPNFPPIQVNNCSMKEVLMTSNCRDFDTMCVGLGGKPKGCRVTEWKTRVLEGDCECHGTLVNYFREGHQCWVIDDCGQPIEVDEMPPCLSDISGTACSDVEFAMCSVGPEANEYLQCLIQNEQNPCKCATVYYTCLRQHAECEEVLAQFACDRLIDRFIKEGTDPSTCNYLSRCRCASSAVSLSPSVIGIIFFAIFWSFLRA